VAHGVKGGGEYAGPVMGIAARGMTIGRHVVDDEDDDDPPPKSFRLCCPVSVIPRSVRSVLSILI